MAAKEAPEDKVVEIVDPERKVDEPEKQQPRPEETEEKDASDEFGGPVSLRKLCSLASRGEMLVLLLGTLGALAHGSGMPIISAMIGEFIDLFWDNRGAVTMSQITALALKFVAISGGLVVVGSLQGFAFPWFAQKQVKKMRPVYLDAALHRDIAWFDVHDIPSLIFGMSNDLEVYVDAFSEKLGQSFMSLGTLLIGFTLGIYYCWQIGLLMILAVFLMGAAGSVTGQAIVEQVTETQGSYAAASKLVAEVLHAIRTVVAFGGERRELVRYEASVEEARRLAVRSKAKVGVGSGVLFGIFISAQGAAFLVGAHLIYDGLDISIGKLSTAMFCCLTAGFSMGQLAPGFAGLGTAKLAMRRFFFMKEHQSEIQTSGCSGKALESIESLKLEGVHFAYPARPSIQVLSGLTLDIKKGQKIGVVGESGSGKSTVMALLERFYDPLQGQVLVNGTDLKLYSVKSLRAQIGYVGQEPVLFATSIKENIKQGKSDATDEDMKRAAKHARLDFVKKLPAKFESFVGSGGSQLSGGQKQRIAIARALVKKPSMLLLDEATSALDGPSEKQIQDTIDKIGSASELGMTIVAIAHRLSTVRNSDVIYVLQGGQVAEQGSHGELLAKDGGIYRTLAATQHMDSEQVQEEADAEEEPQVPKGRASANSLASWGSLQEELAAREEAARTPKTYKVPMRRLLAFCRQEWCFFVPGVIGAMLSGCVFPVSAAYCVVDASAELANPDKDAMMADIKVTALWMLAFACARAVADTVCAGCFGVLAEALCKRCRVAMLTTVFRQEVGFHDDPQNSPARIADALQTWTFRVQNFLTKLKGEASVLAAVLGGSIVALANSWETAAVMLVFMPLVALASSIQIQVQMGGKSKDDLKLRAAQEVLSEALMSVRTVQASNCEEDLLALYSQQLEQASPLKELLSLLSSGIIFGIANGVLFWNYAVGFWMMGFFIVEGRTDYISGMRAFLGVTYAGYGVSIAFGLLGDMGKARAAARDIFQLLDRQTAINGLEPDGQVPAEALQIRRFEFEAVNFHYPFRASIQVLKDFSCVIEAGQSVGIVGPSGGGKSTMLSMIQRFYDPQSGTVYVGKERMPLKDLDIRWWRKQVGFVGQEPVLFDATVLENVMYGFEPDENVSAEWLSHCKAMANLTFLDDHKAQGWETQVGLRGGRLSGGQKQRVAICRALLRNPPVLLLDEATSALDSKSEEVVQAALDRAKMGRTSFAIAHRLSTIQDCDVIVVVADGRVAEQGSHSELLEKKGVYYDLQAQQERKRAG